jgi:hypothetical protein
MKLFPALLLCLCISILAARPARAVTQAWTFDSSNMIVQLIIDDKGGCAATYANVNSTNYLGSLIWFDREGTIRYQVGLSNAFYGGIVECTDKHLLYTDWRPDPGVYHVDDTGTATKVPAAAGTVNTTSGGTIPVTFLLDDMINDKKGFFLISTSTNETSTTLIRYNYK